MIIHMQTKQEIDLHKTPPRSDWQNSNFLGRHYIQGIVRGVYLLMAFEFHVNNGSTKKDVRNAVKDGIQKAFLYGKFEDIARYAKNISTLKIFYSKYLWGNESDIVACNLSTASEVLQKFPSEVSFHALQF